MKNDSIPILKGFGILLMVFVPVDCPGTMFFSSGQSIMDTMKFYTIMETVKMYTTDIKGYIERALLYVMTGNKDCEQISPWVSYCK